MCGPSSKFYTSQVKSGQQGAVAIPRVDQLTKKVTQKEMNAAKLLTLILPCKIPVKNPYIQWECHFVEANR
jgi:hypothetical protein